MNPNIKLLKRLVKWNKSLVGKQFYYYPTVVKSDRLNDGEQVTVQCKESDGVVTVNDFIGNNHVVLLSDLTYNKVE